MVVSSAKLTTPMWPAGEFLASRPTTLIQQMPQEHHSHCRSSTAPRKLRTSKKKEKKILISRMRKGIASTFAKFYGDLHSGEKLKTAKNKVEKMQS